MELPPFDKISKIWAPTKEELKEFCLKNIYVRQMYGDILTEEDYKKAAEEEAKQAAKQAAEKAAEKPEEPGPSTSPFGEHPIHSYLYTLIKKDIYYAADGRPSNGVHFMEEEAIILSAMLEREGFVFDDEDHGCMVCATERLEKELMDMMKRQLQITKFARDYYTKTENEKRFNICANHRVFNPKNCIPRINGFRPPLRPDLITELARGSQEQTELPSNYFNIPNFAPSGHLPEVIREEDFHAEMKFFQMRAQANQANLNSFGVQAGPSRPVLSNNIDQPSAIALPDKISVPANLFIPNQIQATTSTFWDSSAQELAINYLSDPAINQQTAANFLSARANGQIASANYMVNNMAAQASSANILTNNLAAQTSSANFMTNIAAQTSSANFLTNNLNGQASTANYLTNNITGHPQTSAANFIANRIAGQNLASNNYPNAALTSANNYFANNVNGEINLMNLPVPNNGQLFNRQTNLQSQAARQALINNAINNVQDQHRGRKILGKKY